VLALGFTGGFTNACARQTGPGVPPGAEKYTMIIKASSSEGKPYSVTVGASGEGWPEEPPVTYPVAEGPYTQTLDYTPGTKVTVTVIVRGKGQNHCQVTDGTGFVNVPGKGPGAEARCIWTSMRS